MRDVTTTLTRGGGHICSNARLWKRVFNGEGAEFRSKMPLLISQTMRLILCKPGADAVPYSFLLMAVSFVQGQAVMDRVMHDMLHPSKFHGSNPRLPYPEKGLRGQARIHDQHGAHFTIDKCAFPKWLID